MPLHFFTDSTGKKFELSGQVARLIFSLLHPADLSNASLVNREWARFVASTRQYMRLLPPLKSLSLFSQVTIDVVEFKIMTGGMTNVTCKVDIGRDFDDDTRPKPKSWVVRFPGNSDSLGIVRAAEKYNAEQAALLELNIPIAEFDPNTGMQATNYIEDVKTVDAKMLERQEILGELAAIAKKLHASSAFANDTPVFDRNDALFNGLRRTKFKFDPEVDFVIPQMSYLKRLFASYEFKLHPCHNDPTLSNYISFFDKTKKQELLRLIDWEYSGNNDFFWDLAYFSIEAKLTREQEEVYLNAYFGGEVPKEAQAWFTAYKPLVEWWITLWAWTQLNNKADSVDLSEYEKMGIERFAKTCAYLNSDEFKDAVSVIESRRTSTVALTPRPF